MKLAMSIALFLSMCLAPGAHALTQDWGGLEHDWSMPTLDGPTMTVCYAVARNNQRCRACRQQYDEFGQLTELRVVCAFVPQKASCGCNFPNRGKDCQAYGYCEYFQ